MTSTTGVLVMSYGTPASRDEIAPYYTKIRHGRPPSDEQLADLVRRYDAIGGLSPLNERTADQVAGIAATLERRAPGRYVVAPGTKYATPTIEDGANGLASLGVDSVVGLVLAPLSAPMSTGQYHERAAAAVSGLVPYRPLWSWWDAAGFAELLAARVRAEMASGGAGTLVLFTAHSLPARVVQEGADYPDQLAAAAARVAELAGIERYLVCWQSAGRTQEEWLGPDILEVISAVDPSSTQDVVVCPVGFVADHLEVLFDVDVEARVLGEQRGIAVRRTRSLNASQDFLEVLADLVIGAPDAT